mgnify:FL=1|jgi:hypothetical protein
MKKNQGLAIPEILQTINAIADELARQKKFLLEAIETDNPAYKQWYLEQLADIFKLR